MMKKELLSMKWDVSPFRPFYSLVSAAPSDYNKPEKSYSKLHNFQTNYSRGNRFAPPSHITLPMSTTQEEQQPTLNPIESPAKQPFNFGSRSSKLTFLHDFHLPVT